MPTLLIRHFKSIIEQKLELGTVNVFIGANGAGKSNVLESLGILGAAAYGIVDDDTLSRHGVRPGLPRLYKSAFAQIPINPNIHFEVEDGDGRYTVSLHNGVERTMAQWKFKTEEFKSKGKVLMSRGPKTKDNKGRGLAPLILANEKNGDPCAQLLKKLEDFRIFSPHTPILRGLMPDANNRTPIGLSGGRLAEAVQELLGLIQKDPERLEAWTSILELVDWTKTVDTVELANRILSPSVPRQSLILRFTDKYMRPGKNTLTAHDASEGVLYVLFLAVVMLHPGSPQWCAIDNVDQALNPKLIQSLMRWVCQTALTDAQKERCLLLTLHNPAALDGLPLRDERIRLFAVDRTTAGVTVVERIQITEELAQLAQEKNWPLSRLWVMGHLGGVPNV